MKRNFLILLCLILFIVSIAAVSATEDVNQTDNLELSMNSNSEDKVDLDNNNGLDENNDLNKKLESDSNILAMSKADKLTGKEIVVENFTFKDIQKAVDSAKDGDTVYLKAGTYLNNGKGQININQNNISIVGVKDSTILDAQKTSRIFNIESKSGITIKDIVFINGNADRGGAIYVHNAIDNVNIDATFINNTASGDGGAIYFQNTGTVSNCNFAGNTATKSGGAIYFDENGDVTDCNFTGNLANNTGGAVYFNGIGEVSNSNFISNEANGEKSSGGAIYFNATGNIINSIFTANKATRTGGAIYVGAKSTNNNFSGQFYNNHAGQSGGAIFFRNSVENNTFDGIFKDNTAGYGAGMFFYKDANGNKIEGEFINNTAKSCGGAMFFYSTTDKNNFSGIFINNSALGLLDPTVGNGGAITFKNVSTNSIFTCDFINNTANLNGGGVNYRESPSNITFNSNFINNTSPTGGGVNFFKTFKNVVFNGEFIGNSARYGGAIAAYDGIISDVSFRDNIAVMGGAIYFNGTGEVSNCIFTNNEAVAEYDGGGAISMISGNVIGSVFKANKASGVGSMGGAVLIENSGNVTNCRFEDNSAEFGGAVSSDRTVNIADCNFTANRASVEGGAFYTGSCNIENSNFTNNIASNGRYSGDGGAVYINGNATVVNCDFIGNEASRGPAIYFWNLHESKHVRSISHSTFLNNKANMDSIAPFTLTVNGTNIEIAFHGNNNLFNAILSRLKGDVNVTNVTYWGASGIENTGDSTIVPVMLYTQSGQNVTVRGVVDGVEVNITRSTDAEGKIVLENVREYNITVSHDEDSYYFSGKTFFTSRQLSLNMTDITTNDFTVNITAKSDIFEEYMSGEMIFRVDGQEFYASYAGNGTWWAMHTFDDFGTYKVSALFDGPYNVIVRNGTIAVNKIKTEITGSAITATYNVNKYLVITLKDGTGKALSDVKVTVNLNGAKTYTTDSNGQIKVSTKGLAPKAYTAKVAFNGDAVYDKSAKDIKVTVKKATPKLTAKKKTFKRSVKVKKYSIVLKNNVGKAIKKAKVTIKIGKKTFKAKTNSKGKATFKIKKLTKKGNYKAKVSYNGSKYYNKVTKKVKIRIK